MSDSEDGRIASPPADSPLADDDAIGSGDDLFGDAGSDAGSNASGGGGSRGGGGGGGGGDDDDDEGQLSDQPLSEHSLNSDDDDEERYGGGGAGRHQQQQQQTKEEVVMDMDIFRHRTPKSADGTLQSLRIPPFIKINPEEYRADSFEPSEFDLENSLAKNPHSTVRFRRDPDDAGTLQSNAAIYRWSDGSVTLAVGDEHFEVLTKGLAPPPSDTKPYQELQDAHYYAAAAHLSSSLLLTVGHVTEQYSVRANHTVADDALKRLTDRLQAASQGSANANMIIRTVRDPELAKKEAELAEKERERARRRRETAAARLDGVPGSGRSGGGSWGGALSVGDLEGTAGGRRGAGGGGRKKGGAGGPARAKRHRDEYDSDDELPRGARRNDEYDKADDFIAPSDDDVEDEEDAEGDDDDEEEEEEEEEEMLEDDDEADSRAAASSRRAKRQKTAEAEDNGGGGGGGGNDAHTARRNRRHIIDDDDDDDE